MNYNNAIEILLKVLTILKDNGVNINNILKNSVGNNVKYLKDINQYGINMSEIIKKYNLSPYYKIITQIKILIKICNGEIRLQISDEQKRKIKDLELDTSNKSEISLAIEILETLLDSGVNLKYVKNIGGPLLLKDIKQPGLNIIKIMEDNDLNPDLDIGSLINRLKKSYKQAKHSSLTNDDITRLEDLKRVGDKDSDEEIGEETIQNYIAVLDILRNNRINLKNLGICLQKKDNKTIQLKDLKLPGVVMERALDENNIDINLTIGKFIEELEKGYKKRDDSVGNQESRSIIDELGLFKSGVTKALDTLEVLKLNGIDVTKIKMQIRKEGTCRSSMLKDINQPGIDIMRIIDENGLNPEENIGTKIAWINQRYKGTRKPPLTSKERKKAEELGIIRGKLREKEKEQQCLQQKLDDAKELHNKVKNIETFKDPEEQK